MTSPENSKNSEEVIVTFLGQCRGENRGQGQSEGEGQGEDVVRGDDRWPGIGRG